MALTDLSRAFADLSTHTKRLEEARARKAELRLELDAVNAVIGAAGSAVETTQKLGDGVLHIGKVNDGRIEAGQSAQLEVDADRDLTRKNHTATHLMHWALRGVLGEHVKQ